MAAGALSSRTRPGDNAPGRQRPSGDLLQSALRLIVAVAVSGACLYWATRGTDWQQVSDALRGAHVGWVLAVIGVSLTCHALRAERWRVLLRPVGAVPFVPAFRATLVGFGASAVLPLRLGEIVRPALLARSVRIPLSAALSSIVLERILDILLVIGCLLLVGAIYEVPAWLQLGAMVLGAGAATALVVLVAMQRRRAAAERIIRRMLGVLPSRVGTALWPVADGLLRGLGGLGDGRTVGLVVVYSVGLWFLIMLTYLLSFLAMDVDIPLVAGSLVTVVIVAASVFLPQAPGFVGTWQAGCVIALGIFGVPKDVAVGYSLLTWAIQMTVNVGSAAIALAFEDVSVRDLVRQRQPEVSEG